MAEQYAFYECPFGYWKIGYEDGNITQIRCVTEPEEIALPCSLSDQAAFQLQAYLQGHQTSFTLPIAPKGTPFQRSIWHTLRTIPFGQTRTYGQIAAAAGNPKALRAVGMACKMNPIWIVIPCHRVIGANKSLTGYAGGLHVKQFLLNLEQKSKQTPETI